MNSASAHYCQHVVATKLAYKENKKDKTISRLLQVSCYYIIPILGHSTSKVVQKEVANKEREIRRQEKEAKNTQQATIVANANIMRIQR
jgi:hypothetical protein